MCFTANVCLLLLAWLLFKQNAGPFSKPPVEDPDKKPKKPPRSPPPTRDNSHDDLYKRGFDIPDTLTPLSDVYEGKLELVSAVCLELSVCL